MKNANTPERGLVRGVGLNPGTPLEALVPLLDELELILILAVNPGWGGQKILAKVMAQELALAGIRVNLVAPGLVMAGLTKHIYDTDIDFRAKAAKAVPVGYFQLPDSVSAAFAFLCSRDADYMTGATILIDGGCSLVRRD